MDFSTYTKNTFHISVIFPLIYNEIRISEIQVCYVINLCAIFCEIHEKSRSLVGNFLSTFSLEHLFPFWVDQIIGLNLQYFFSIQEQTSGLLVEY